MKRSYRQSCALAHALDRVGERWTLLVVRELLIAPRRYGELLANLAGMGTNLLADRLREMQDDGLVIQNGSYYSLSEAGRLLEPVVHALVRFGLSLDIPADARRLSRPEWDAVAISAMFEPIRAGKLEGTYALTIAGQDFTLALMGGALTVSVGLPQRWRARASFSTATSRLLRGGRLSVRDAIRRGLVQVDGNRTEARQLLNSFIGDAP